MELRHLRYFLAIWEARSFSQAAARLHVTQPTLSHQLRQLEDEVGSTLLVRSGRQIALSAAGEVFLEYARRAVAEAEQGVAAIAELEGLVRGRLRVAVFHSYSNSRLPGVLADFCARYPNVHVVVRQVSREAIEEGLLQGELDIAVAYSDFDTEHLQVEKLFDEPLVLAVAEDHPLARRTRLAFPRLADVPLALLTQEYGARRFLDELFAECGVRPRIVLEIDGVDPILATIRHSGLATVLSAGAVSGAPGMHCIGLTDPTPRRTASILWRKRGGPSPAAARLLDMIKHAYANALGAA